MAISVFQEIEKWKANRTRNREIQLVIEVSLRDGGKLIVKLWQTFRNLSYGMSTSWFRWPLQENYISNSRIKPDIFIVQNFYVIQLIIILYLNELYTSTY